MFGKILQYVVSSDEAETLCTLSRSLHLCFTESERQKHFLISVVERHLRTTSKPSPFLAICLKMLIGKDQLANHYKNALNVK